MPIFRAVGLGVCIIVLKFLVPTIFHELEATIIALLEGARISATVASTLAASAGTLPNHAVSLSATPPFPLPSAPLPHH